MNGLLLTRRALLQHFAAIGGSSLVLGTLDAWDLNGERSRPRPALQRGDRAGKVLILGAGVSGLVAAHELAKLGYDCHVLEARNRVGGLCWSVRRGDSHTEIGGETQVCDFDEGLYFNAGAWRIPHADRSVLDYCRELNVPLELFVDASEANYFYEEDPALGPLSGKRIRLREVSADLWGSTTELLATAIDHGDIDVPLSTEDKGRLVEFLVRAGYLDSEDHLYRPPEIRGSPDRYDLAALLSSGFGSRVRSLYEGIGGPAPVFQPVGGMQQIPIALARAIGNDRIRFGAEVRSIRSAESDVRVVWRDTRTGQSHEETADYCVCCLPMSITRKIEITLSPDMAAAIDATGHSDSAKMGVQTRRRFWEEDEGIFGGHLWSRSLQLGEFSYPSNDYFTKKGVLLGYYGSGSQAGLADKPVAGRIEHVISRTSKVHPQIRQEFETAYAVWWDKVPFSEGAYGRSPAQQARERFAKPDGRIVFGSAGTGDRPAWIEGAVQASWQAVKALHERAQAG